MSEKPYPAGTDNEDVLLSGVCSTEMTGLIPAGHPEQDERDSYQDVLPYFPPFGNPRPAI